MTSSNGNTFRVTGLLCGEFTGHKGQWRRALIFSLICAWINGWVNNRAAGDLRRHRVHYDVTVTFMKNTHFYFGEHFTKFYVITHCTLDTRNPSCICLTSFFFINTGHIWVNLAHIFREPIRDYNFGKSINWFFLISNTNLFILRKWDCFISL